MRDVRFAEWPARRQGLAVKARRAVGRRWSLLTYLLDLVDDRITYMSERRVRAVLPDIQATRIPGTRTIEYRLPVWSLREECSSCAGTGLDGARRCTPCHGTGVFTRTEHVERWS